MKTIKHFIIILNLLLCSFICCAEQHFKQQKKIECKIDYLICDTISNYEFYKFELTPTKPVSISFYVKINDMIDSLTIHKNNIYIKRFFYVISVIESLDEIIYLHSNGSEFIRNTNSIKLNISKRTTSKSYGDSHITEKKYLKSDKENILLTIKYFDSKKKEMLKIEYIAKLN